MCMWHKAKNSKLYKALENFVNHEQIFLQANDFVIPYIGIWRGRNNILVGDYKLLAK